MKKIIATFCVLFLALGVLAPAAYASPEDTEYPNYANVELKTNSNGLVLAISKDTGVEFIYDEDSGYWFKDLNKNDEIDVYEDWREDIDTRTADLLSQMSLTEKYALMAHGGNFDNGYRMSVVRGIGKGATADGNNGNLRQRNAEASKYGIPYSFSSDPVHIGIQDTGTQDPWDEQQILPVDGITLWPNTLGLANSFNSELHYQYGQIISKEYRNSQIFQQLGPLFDQATHPVWSRIQSAVTEDYDLLIDLVQAEISGMQTTEGDPIKDYGLPEGWGKDSIGAMSKHLLGTGSGEFGYEGHTQIGGWLAYPGGGYEKMIEVMADASGFGLYEPHSSKIANAAMTAYGIDVGNDGLGRHNSFLGDKRFSLSGGGWSNFIMNEYLREGRNWDGMITSDWGIYGANGASNQGMQSRHGVSDVMRYFVSYMSGMSQSGGTAASTAIMDQVYNLGVNGDPALGIPAYGEAYMDAMIDGRAGNTIKTIMKCGLFENPYTDPDKSDRETGSAEFNEVAIQGHHESIVMLKNSDNLLPIADKATKIYAVGSYISGGQTGYGAIGHDNRPIVELADRYYDLVDDPADADVGIVMITGPNNGNGTNNVPQTGQFAPYTKTVGREVSLGGYWYHEDGSIVRADEIPNPAIGDYKENMSNIGFTNSGTNNAIRFGETLKVLTDAKEALGDKPLVVIFDYRNVSVPAEFEPLADALLVGVMTSHEAFMNVISGIYEPTGMLAVTFPRSMDHIELSAEDVPDTTPYVDADNNVYQFGFGLNYSGRIVDERTEKYLGLEAINEVELMSGDNVKIPIELLSYKYGPTSFDATVYYDKSELTLVGFENTPGYQLEGEGDQFEFASATAITTNTVIGYAVFKATQGVTVDTSKVTFAMDGAALDIDGNPTMARFNDAEVSILAEIGWVKDATGWKYHITDDTFLTNEWKKTDGLWYYLGEDGYLKTGWFQDDEKWYFLDRNTGTMKTGWINYGQWYYLGNDGAMVTGWLQDGDDRYFLDEINGNIVTGWVEDGEDWYFMDYDTGIMTTNAWVGGYWVSSDGKWDPSAIR